MLRFRTGGRPCNALRYLRAHLFLLLDLEDGFRWVRGPRHPVGEEALHRGEVAPI